MERPKSGHRRHDTGSVTVVDLLRRQQGPVRVPSADETSTDQLLDDLLGPAEPRDGNRGWLSKGAKLAGLAIGSLALCGSVVAASTLTHHRPTPTVAVPTGPSQAVLTGPGVLRPDKVAAQLSPSRPAPTTVPVHSPAAGRVTGTIVGIRTAPTITTAAPRFAPARTAMSGPAAPAEVVRSFYQLAGQSPALAAQLLAPSLLSDEGGFDRAWDSMTQVRIESIHANPDGTVQAGIRMLAPDGTWLRVVERLHVTDGSNPLINGAELLSAQRGG